MAAKSKYKRLKKKKQHQSVIAKSLIHTMGWIGAAILYYVGFSLIFDTPYEYLLKQNSNKFEEQYNALSARYDSLNMVLQNIEIRDKELFRTMFESTPYDFDSEYDNQRLAEYETTFAQSNKELEKNLAERITKVEALTSELVTSAQTMYNNGLNYGKLARNIPAIQPIANRQLTLLTASYGMRMHPFYKTLKSHQGVDFSIPEQTRIFATADGVVKSITTNSTAGKEIVIDHQNGYTTTYSHIKSTTMRRNQKVSRGDIIALSGNTGLSIAPHLHYEVSYNGTRVDPIHYFFKELSPEEYQRIIKIAQSGMQSFD